MDRYLDQCKSLSLTARMAIALCVFERFCEENGLAITQVKDLSNFLWEWPLIDGADEFDSWESKRPELVNVGLGDDASQELTDAINAADLDSVRFRNIVSSLVEILWGSFWGAAEDESSFEALSNVIRNCRVAELPILTPFKFSLFNDGSGWGKKITVEDRDCWRSSARYA